MNDLISLCYASRSLIGEDADQIVDIWETSEQNNERLGITGALYFDGKIFFQVIEGEDKSVQSTFEKIKADPRHEEPRVLSEYFCATRSMGTWNMKVVGKFGDSYLRSKFEWDVLINASVQDINRRIRTVMYA